MAETEENKKVMMHWENLEDSPGKEPYEETEDDLQKNSTELNKEEGPKDKKPAVKNRLFERPSLANLIHISELYKESGSEIRTLKKMERERTKRMQKN